jgi:hypothetical protein
MKSYTIVISGIGSESYVFILTDEQYFATTDIDKPTTMQFINSLGFDDPGSADLIITGPYEDDVMVSVFDEDDDIVFINTEYNSNLNTEYYQTGLESENQLIYENKVQGDFFKFHLQTLEFDPERLKLIFTSVGDKYILTMLEYDNENLQDKDYLDYISFDEEIYKVKGLR